jgi:molecular chaperone Hsp33
MSKVSLAQMHKVQKFYSEDLMLRVSAAVTTDVVREMKSKQKAFPLPIMASGQALTGALLMASQLSAGQRVGLHFRGAGPLGWFYTEASWECEVRGYVSNPQADLRTKDGHLDIAKGLGQGLLTVTRNLPFQKQPHTGIVPLVSGEISQNIAHYLFQSHQIPSVVSLTVALDKDGEVTAAGGVLVEVMPGASEQLINQLEERCRQAPALSKEILAGKPPENFAKHYVHESKLIHVEHPHAIVYSCRCEQERAQRAVGFLGRSTVSEMVLKGKDVEVTCEFCGQSYLVTIAELRAILHPDAH